MRPTCLAAVLALGAAFLLAGCPKPTPVYQPPIDLTECIHRHNQNAGKVEHLWIHCDVDATFQRPGRLPLTLTLEGLLIYRPPRELILKGDAFGEQQFEIGSNPQEYWLWLKSWDMLYVGTWAKRNEPTTAGLPIPAPEVFWMLGVHPITGETIKEAPVLSYSRQEATRHLQFFDVIGPERVRVRRELIFDRTDYLKWPDCKKEPVITKDRVIAVRTYSMDGTLLVEAACEKYRKVTCGGEDIVLPTEFRLEVLGEGTTLRIRLYADELPDALLKEVRDSYFRRRPAPVTDKTLLDEGGKVVPNE